MHVADTNTQRDNSQKPIFGTPVPKTGFQDQIDIFKKPFGKPRGFLFVNYQLNFRLFPHKASVNVCTRGVMKKLNSILNFLLLTVLSIVVSGCSNLSVKDYSAEKPVLSLEEFFSGKVDGYGMLQNRSGKVTRRFHVVIDGRVENGNIILDEAFEWSDGEKQTRVWTIKKTGDGRYEGTAADVVGIADGKVAGNAVNWAYSLAVPVSGSTYNITMDDWMYLISDKVLLNVTKMSKFGFRVGTLTISMSKR